MSDKQPSWMSWTGWVLTVLCAAALLMSAGMKTSDDPEFLKQIETMGFTPELISKIAAVEAICAVMYVIPQTSLLGGILLVGYLGGATVTHLRMGEPVMTPVIFGLVVGLGIWLREPWLRHLLPFRKARLPVLGTDTTES